jgi:exo-beta-1,3-glucanase (GH17 family)
MSRPWVLPQGNAICYSGYREGQSPNSKIFPSKAQIRQDLLILRPHWRLLRLYDCSLHAERVLEVIRSERLDFQVLLGAHLDAEQNNLGCPWGAVFSESQLEANLRENAAEIDRLIVLARLHADTVFAVAVGNEATVHWTDHLVPVPQVISYVKRVKAAVAQPVTCCENYVPWHQTLKDLVPLLDFISLHTYPLWESKPIQEAIGYTQENYIGVARLYPDKPVVITEAGWATRTNGHAMKAEHASEALQARYYEDLMRWTRDAGVLTFVFEAFDEPWKGSSDPLEPEKHWGLFTVDRRPKQVVQAIDAGPSSS